MYKVGFHAVAKIFLAGFIACIPQNARSEGLLDTIQNSLGTLLAYPFAHKAASKETQEYVNGLAKELNGQESKVNVKIMNSLAHYLFGYQNALALPGLNTILVNEKWLKKLEDEQKRFTVGRTLVHMSKPIEYALYKYVLPILTNAFVHLNLKLDPPYIIPQDELEYTSSEERRYMEERNLQLRLNDLYDICGTLLKQYFSRQLEYEADKEAALKLNCVQGGIDTLKGLSKFKHDGTPLGAISSTFPVLLVSFYGAKALRNFMIRQKAIGKAMKGQGKLSKAQQEAIGSAANLKDLEDHTVKFGELSLGDFYSYMLPLYVRDNMPGKFTNISTRLENFLLNIPLVRYFWSYPRPIDRIAQLKTIAHKLEQEKENGTKTATK